jgi:hypothetical protein
MPFNSEIENSNRASRRKGPSWRIRMKTKFLRRSELYVRKMTNFEALLVARMTHISTKNCLLSHCRLAAAGGSGIPCTLNWVRPRRAKGRTRLSRVGSAQSGSQFPETERRCARARRLSFQLMGLTCGGHLNVRRLQWRIGIWKRETVLSRLRPWTMLFLRSWGHPRDHAVREEPLSALECDTSLRPDYAPSSTYCLSRFIVNRPIGRCGSVPALLTTTKQISTISERIQSLR